MEYTEGFTPLNEYLKGKKEEIYQIQDNSGDKKYFTIIPNYILNHSSAVDQALYLQMKRIAGEKNECSAGIRYFKKQLGIGSKTLNKSVKYLLQHKWIEFLGKKEIKTLGGIQHINTYRINDIWRLNSDYYKGVSK